MRVPKTRFRARFLKHWDGLCSLGQDEKIFLCGVPLAERNNVIGALFRQFQRARVSLCLFRIVCRGGEKRKRGLLHLRYGTEASNKRRLGESHLLVVEDAAFWDEHNMDFFLSVRGSVVLLYDNADEAIKACNEYAGSNARVVHWKRR